MKLYQSYKKIIENLKPIELAWFTTFNLDPELIEKFLLPYIGDKDPSEIKTAEDYEALNIDLQNKTIKVWFDYRGINLRSDKRTTIDFIPVNLEIFYNAKTDAIFHPKVIFLKGKTDAYLIVGSANLSVAAWSSNKEAVMIRKIVQKENALQILSFFQALNQDTKSLDKWANSLDKNKSDWTFIHSFDQGWNILNHFEKNEEEITIWSPYFSKNTTALLNYFKKHGFKKITLVPDIGDNGKVRITEDELLNLKQDPAFQIQKVHKSEEQQRLHHAKVWLTPSTLAIGSWNCSHRATGIAVKPAEKNIEAGMILNIQPANYKTLKLSLLPLNYNQVIGSSLEEMEKEWEAVLNPFTYSLNIIANWQSFEYNLVEEDLDNTVTVSLPHNPKEKILLSRLNGLSFRKEYKKLLKDKNFTVYNAANEQIYQGFILEENKNLRPVFGYVSLIDLLESLLDDPGGETSRKKINYQVPGEDDSGISEISRPLLEYSGTQSYYLMFVAFQKLHSHIVELINSKEKLDNLGFRLPGSVINIRELVVESIETAMVKKDKDSALFHWFLLNEINRCITEFNKHSEAKIENIEIDELNKYIGFAAQDLKFLEKLKSEFGYEFK